MRVFCLEFTLIFFRQKWDQICFFSALSLNLLEVDNKTLDSCFESSIRGSCTPSDFWESSGIINLPVFSKLSCHYAKGIFLSYAEKFCIKIALFRNRWNNCVLADAWCNEIRDMFAKIMHDLCYGVDVEPALQMLERFFSKSYSNDDNTGINI